MNDSNMNGHEQAPPDEEEVPLSLEVESTPRTANGFGQVTLLFNVPVGLITIDGDTAIELAQRLIAHAKVAGYSRAHSLSI